MASLCVLEQSYWYHYLKATIRFDVREQVYRWAERIAVLMTDFIRVTNISSIVSYLSKAESGNVSGMTSLGADDFSAKEGALMAFGADTQATEEKRITASKDSRAFGSTAGQTLAAGFDISHVPGMYEGRPERFFDDPNDIRSHKLVVEDSHITRLVNCGISASSRSVRIVSLFTRKFSDLPCNRNALAPNLLDIDAFAGNTLDGGLAYDPNLTSTEVVEAVQVSETSMGGGAELPLDNLAESATDNRLKAQIEAQKKQLEFLQAKLYDQQQPMQKEQSWHSVGQVMNGFNNEISQRNQQFQNPHQIPMPASCISGHSDKALRLPLGQASIEGRVESVSNIAGMTELLAFPNDACAGTGNGNIVMASKQSQIGFNGTFSNNSQITSYQQANQSWGGDIGNGTNVGQQCLQQHASEMKSPKYQEQMFIGLGGSLANRAESQQQASRKFTSSTQAWSEDSSLPATGKNAPTSTISLTRHSQSLQDTGNLLDEWSSSDVVTDGKMKELERLKAQLEKQRRLLASQQQSAMWDHNTP